MDRFKVITEAFNQNLSQLFSVNSVYDGCFQTEIEPNVLLMLQKLMIAIVSVNFLENESLS